MSNLNWQEIGQVQNEAGKGVRTIASATSISPTTPLTKLTGAVALATVVPPVDGAHVLYLVSTDGVIVIGTGGNILVGYSTVQNRPIALIYDPLQGKYYINAVV